MCGIAGAFWGLPRNAGELQRSAQSMAAVLQHRGPDDAGSWCDPDAGICFGFRRLAILDLSPAGHQPMTTPDGRHTIVFNGEIYNYRELRRQLECDAGASFRGTSDTEVILAGAAHWGLEAVIPRLWGMFAIALWDARERILLLARDRLGKKPLYFVARPGMLAFASELKALRALPGWTPRIDRQAVAAFLRFGYVPAPWTIYEGVSKLSPGCLLMAKDPADPRVERYWDPRVLQAAAVPSMDEGDLLDEASALIGDAVARRQVADVPLGAFLSGGIDSSLVVSMMRRTCSGRVRTFTIGFENDEFDEAVEARRVARVLETEHVEVLLSPKAALDEVDGLADVYDEPFADASQIPTLLVSKVARQHVTVALSGDGGDETFGGYVRYVWADRAWRYMSHVPTPIRRWLAHVAQHLPVDAVAGAYSATRGVLPSGARQRHPAEKLRKLIGVLDADSADALYRRLVSVWPDPGSIVPDVTERPSMLDALASDAAPAGFVDRMMLADLMTYLPDDILTKVDRASMAVSLEARAPLLDHRLVEWAWRLPMQQRVFAGRGKWILRRLLARELPGLVFDRPKTGFGVPIGHWLRGPLRDWAMDLLTAPVLVGDGLLNPRPVQSLWARHQGGGADESPRLWAVLMLAAWRVRWRV